MAMQRKALGDRHPNVATTLNSLSRVLAGQQRYAEAAAALQEALDIARPVLGDHHQLVAIYTLNLASVCLADGNAAAAAALAGQGIEIRERAPTVVPSRRRTYLQDDWTLDAAKNLLSEAEKARALQPTAR
jgi:tetratricopeptide (TPR) repeat protein